MALRKFHRFTGLLGFGWASLGGLISEGRCCDLGNFPKIHLSGKRLSKSTLANARFGLVSVFQRPEWKLAASLGLYSKVKLLALAQPARHSLSGLLLS